MSKVFRDISSIDMMPNHVETSSRIFGHTVGKSTFRSGLAERERLNLQFGSSNYVENLSDRRLQPSPVQHTTSTLQSKLNQDPRSGTLAQRSAMSRTFGLQVRNLPSSCPESSLNHQDINGVHHRSAVSTVSRTFGLVSEGLNSVNAQSNEISNLDLRSASVNASLMPRTFGLQTRNLTMHSHLFSENDLRGNPDLDFMNCRRSSVTAVSRTFDLGTARVGGGGGGCGSGSLSAHDNEGFIQDLRRNGNINSSLIAKPFGHHSRNLTVHSSLLAEGNANCKVNGLSTGYKSFGPRVRSSALIAESRVQERGTSNDEVVENGGFRRPTLSRVIRGRNSLLSSRLFHSQNMERHCRDLSNINGFNVSHIGRRDLDSLSESRMALNVRSNWMDNQSMAGSVLSAASMKGQFMNLLENLHHSILNIGPHVTAEAVRMEFDRAKQGLENICEISLAPSVREADAASVISQSSKYICPPVNEPATDTVIDGGSLHLKSSKEVLKTFFSRKDSYRRKFNLSGDAEEGRRRKAALTTSPKDSDDEQVSEFLFKKPKERPKRKKASRSAKIKASETVTTLASVETSKVFSLKQWYPVAFGSDLALCGVDEQGVSVKTDPVKKRLNSRRVELVSGLICNLIGSPSPTVSELPKKVAALLKNGLTERWRVLQGELVNCQTAEKGCVKRKSRSPKVARSPQKEVAGAGKTGEGRATKAKQSSPKVMPEAKKLKMMTPIANKGKSKSPKILISPKRSGKGAEVLTRSGRTVKPPTMFWLVARSNEVSSSQTSATPKTISTGGSPKKKYKRSNEGIPAKEMSKGTVVSSKEQDRKDVACMRYSLHGKSKKAGNASSRGRVKGRPPQARSPKGNKKKESEEMRRVHSSTEDAKRQMRANKRRREITGDIDAVETKRSKLEKITKVEAESAVEDTGSVTRKERKIKGGLRAHSTKVKAMKSPAKKSNKSRKKKTLRETESENKTERKELNEFEEDFELQLDDIEIPEIANVSGNPRLSRSQLRVVSMETPPLKYFNSNLRLLRSATPIRSPDWCISQRTESEVKRFQKRREEAFKKKTRVDLKQTIVTEKATKTVQSKELKRVMEWIAEKTVKSPAWNSRVVQYFIPSRKQLEQQDDDGEEEEEDEGGESECLKPSFG